MAQWYNYLGLYIFVIADLKGATHKIFVCCDDSDPLPASRIFWRPTVCSKLSSAS